VRPGEALAAPGNPGLADSTIVNAGAKLRPAHVYKRNCVDKKERGTTTTVGGGLRWRAIGSSNYLITHTARLPLHLCSPRRTQSLFAFVWEPEHLCTSRPHAARLHIGSISISLAVPDPVAASIGADKEARHPTFPYPIPLQNLESTQWTLRSGRDAAKSMRSRALPLWSTKTERQDPSATR